MSEKDLIRCELLVIRYQRNDRQAAAKELLELFEKPLLYYLRRLVRSEADAWDLLQETFFAVLRNLQQMRDGRALPAYVYRVARNAALGFLRSNKRLEPLDENAHQLAGDEPDEDFSAQDAQRVHRALDELPLAQREVLTLFFLKDLSIEQIAQVANSAAGTVKSRLHYAKKAMKQLLEVSHV